MAGQLVTVMSTKGQVILPKAVRDRRRWPAGTRLTVEDTAEGVILKPAPLFEPTAIDEVFGALAHGGRSLSTDDMTAAVATEAARRGRD